jgi:lysozyme
MNMKMSDNGIKKLKLWEGFKNNAYLDSGGRPTIGVGHLITKAERASGKILIGNTQVKYRNGLSGDEVYSLLKQDIDPVETLIDKLVIVPLTPNQFDVMVSFTFNVGVESFMTSTLLRNLNNGLYDRIPAQLKRWIYDDGKIVQGLINRRNNEIALWLS